MHKLILLASLLIFTVKTHSKPDIKICTLLSSEHEKLVAYIVEKYKINEHEARYLLRFCDHLQSVEDFNNHVKRQDFERYFRELLYKKHKDRTI